MAEIGGHAQAYGVMRREIRAIRRKLDCLNPNLQKVQLNTRWKDACNQRRLLRQDEQWPAVVLWSTERCPIRVFKEMSGTPKSR